MGGMRLAVPAVAMATGALTLATALVPLIEPAYPVPALHVAVATAGPLIALCAAVLVLICFLQRGQAGELVLLCSLVTLALSELAFTAVPVGPPRVSQALLAWAAVSGRAAGAALFAVAAFTGSTGSTGFAPHRRLGRPGLALAGGATAVTAVLALIAVLVVSFAPGPPAIPVAAARSRLLLVRAGPGADAVLLGLGIAVVLAYVVASAGFFRRWSASARPGGIPDEFCGWLAIAAILAASAQVNSTLYPAFTAHLVYLADLLRLCSYAAVFAGAATRSLSWWQATPGVAVLEERRRIARDLHDGLAQELAYLRRHLCDLGGMADSEANEQLRLAAERAEQQARLAVTGLGGRRREPVDVTVARSVGELAARDRIDLELDIPPGIRLPPARAEALMRIACEAVGNAARHSGARRVALSVRRAGPWVRLVVSDSGCGFDTAARVGGFGLASMDERARLVGGELRISSVPGGGTEVEATL